ncbi:unnamed protein product, partial [Mesorhabditis belari]|uniref:Uncharacterized protein n=1 Tax=Mesorhabditis belari TaxID=2138241 RepID=A0AAF3FIA6_9BILA
MNETDVSNNGTMLDAISKASSSPTTMLASTTAVPTTSMPKSIEESTWLPSTSDRASVTLFIFSFILFVVAVALIAKVVISRPNRRNIIGGTARWRLSTSSQSAAPLQTDATYTPVGNTRTNNNRNPLDASGENRLDWERQFFDEQEASSQEPSRLRLDFSRM